MDLAVVGSFTPASHLSTDLAWRGRLVDSAFGAHLARQPGELYYWPDGRYQIDFVHQHEGVIPSYEVKSGRGRDGKGLFQFVSRYRQATSRLITDAEIEELLQDN